jgi:hypothetical protein
MKMPKLSVHCAVDDCRAWATQTVDISLNNKPAKHLPVCKRHFDAAKEDIATDAPAGNLSKFTKAEIINDLNNYNGVPPHDGFNPCAGDNIFLRSLTEKYGVSIGELHKYVDYTSVISDWQAVRNAFIKRH